MLEKEILEQLFRRYYSDMYYLARTLLDEDKEAEDIVQDVFVRLMKQDIIPPEDKIRTYLMTSVHHGCLNIIRKASLRKRIENMYPVDETTDQQPTDKISEQLETIQSYVESLEEPHHSIFHLRFDEDLTLKEIALRLNMNQNTVYKYLQQSIRQIRSKLYH